MNIMTTQEKIQAILSKMGWQQQELAPRLGVSQSRVSQLLNGGTPSAAVQQLLDALYARLNSPGGILRGFVPGKPGRCMISANFAEAVGLDQEQHEAYQQALSLYDPLTGGEAIECLEHAGFDCVFQVKLK